MDCSDQIVPYDFGRKSFPDKVDGKLNTMDFLEASRGIVILVDKLGTTFSPLSKDILNNIEKIKKCYDKDPSKYIFIEDMILCEKSANEELSVDALLWLQRALHFIYVFFQNVVNDERKAECLKEHMTLAYSQTLEPYHGWITRQLFKVFKNVVPTRTDLLTTISNDTSDETKEELVKFLQNYIQGLAENVSHIMSFYKKYNLGSEAKNCSDCVSLEIK